MTTAGHHQPGQSPARPTPTGLDLLGAMDRPRPRRAHEHVAEEIRRRIGLRLVRAGESLPSDREMAEEFGVGRATVQAAIRMLEAERLVVTRRGRHGGTFVLSLHDDELARDYLVARLRRNAPAIQQAVAFRDIVEPHAAALAAAHRTDDDLTVIREAAESAATVEDDATFTARDNAFHLAIAAASHNVFIHEAVVQIRLVLNDALLARPADPVWQRRTAVEHDAILDALVAGDGAAAEQAMRAHTAWTAENVQRMLADLSGS
ncbi:MAG: FadR family transcriptional regulator [Solirubrobacteraceae bacterium]|nr:FadR family transcriptional regulator [Solirubrobacteraceae bacterium]